MGRSRIAISHASLSHILPDQSFLSEARQSGKASLGVRLGVRRLGAWLPSAFEEDWCPYFSQKSNHGVSWPMIARRASGAGQDDEFLCRRQRPLPGISGVCNRAIFANRSARAGTATFEDRQGVPLAYSRCLRHDTQTFVSAASRSSSATKTSERKPHTAASWHASEIMPLWIIRLRRVRNGRFCSCHRSPACGRKLDLHPLSTIQSCHPGLSAA